MADDTQQPMAAPDKNAQPASAGDAAKADAARRSSHGISRSRRGQLAAAAKEGTRKLASRKTARTRSAALTAMTGQPTQPRRAAGRVRKVKIADSQASKEAATKSPSQAKEEVSQEPKPIFAKAPEDRQSKQPENHAPENRSPEAGSQKEQVRKTGEEVRSRQNKAEVDERQGSDEGQTKEGQETTRRRRPGRPPKNASKKPREDGEETEEGRTQRQRQRQNRDNRDVRSQDRGGRDDRSEGRHERDNHQNNRNQNNNRQNYNNYNDRRNNRHQKKQQMPTEPSLSRDMVAEMKVAELRERAAELGIPYLGVRKKELADAVYDAAAKAEGFRSVSGILDIGNEGYGFIRTGNYMPGENDAFVPQMMIRSMGLRRGDHIEGTVRPSRPNDRYPALAKIASINGADPTEAKARPRFSDLTPVYPDERLRLENGRESITGRAIDLVAPIGKGQRGLIVSPPKAGKTTVLKRICQSITHNNPEVHLICLLVDERPEEVTDMQRSIHGDVVASTFDMPADNHTAVAELVIERAKRLVEQGQDVVVVLDSITRLARAYNLAAPVSGRILSGGVDSAALYPPKHFLGAARNIEGGGSLTIIASALIETGSKMDEVIFEEFKGTGNMELKLDRELADKRIFPAIDPVASGTRNEDLLIDATMSPFVWGLRRILANMNNVERAEASLIKGLKQTDTNEEFLIRSAKKAAQTDYVD